VRGEREMQASGIRDSESEHRSERNCRWRTGSVSGRRGKNPRGRRMDPPWEQGTRMRSALSRSHSFLLPFYRATIDSRISICTNSGKMIFLWWSPLFLHRRKNRKMAFTTEKSAGGWVRAAGRGQREDRWRHGNGSKAPVSIFLTPDPWPLTPIQAGSAVRAACEAGVSMRILWMRRLSASSTVNRSCRQVRTSRFLGTWPSLA
jgi:hypothetical protein